MTKFYGIGVGPGEEELITLKAVKVLGELDIIMIPETKKGEPGVAYQIIEKYLKPTTQKQFVYFPMVKDEAVFEKVGKETAERIVEALEKDLNIGFVTLGDAMIYSTYGYILKHLPDKGKVETIPGIPSFCSAAALANQPLVEKDDIFTLIPMNASDEKIEKALLTADSLAFLKIYKREKRVLSHLKKHALEKQSLLAKRCGFKDARVDQELETALQENKDYLTLVLSRKEKKQW